MCVYIYIHMQNSNDSDVFGGFGNKARRVHHATPSWCYTAERVRCGRPTLPSLTTRILDALIWAPKNEQIHYCTTPRFPTTYFGLWDGINLRFFNCDCSKGLLDPFQYLWELVFPPDHLLFYIVFFDLWDMNQSGSNIQGGFETSCFVFPWLHARYLYDLFDHDATRLSKALACDELGRWEGRPHRELWQWGNGLFPLQTSAQNGRF